MIDKLNIYQKLVEVRKGIASFKKDTQGYNFTYVSGTQVLSAIKDDLDKYGIILEQHLTNPTAENGVVQSPMKMVWVNADNPEKERIVIDWFMVGTQKDLSQSFGSGLTYAERYFMLKFFNIPTDKDDPDGLNKGKDKSKGKPPADPLADKSGKKVTEKQINRYFAMAKQAGVDEPMFSDWIKEKLGVKSKKDLTMTQMDKIYGMLEKKIEENKNPPEELSQEEEDQIPF